MKTLITLGCIVLLLGCGEAQPDYVKGSTFYAINDSGIRYFRDERTGLCFAERGISKDYAFTCVPCDSVNHLIK